MSEPTEPVAQIEPANWAEFLREFSTRNHNRRARFEVFRLRNVEEEVKEAHLEDISLKRVGDKANVEVIRIDRGDRNAEKMKDQITDVRGISVQFDTDGSEIALEITDDENSLICLKLESKVDGAS